MQPEKQHKVNIYMKKLICMKNIACLWEIRLGIFIKENEIKGTDMDELNNLIDRELRKYSK